MIKKTLAIIAGGKSSRMGYEDKAFIKFKDKTFIDNIIEASCDFEEIIIISNKIESYKNFKVFKDIYKECGPLGGIHSALLNAKYDKVLCIACDMPLIQKDTLNLMAKIEDNYEILIPRINDRLQPLCSIYSKDLIPEIEEALINGKNKLQKFILEKNYKIIDNIKYENLSLKEFSNINNKEDLKVLEEK